MQLAEPAGRRAVEERRARRGPGAAPGARARCVVERARRGQRLEVALDVEEIDGARRLAPLLRQRGAEGEAAEAQRLRVAAVRARGTRGPISKTRTRVALRFRFVRSVSTRPGSSDVRITSSCAAIGLSTRIGCAAGDRARASIAGRQKLKVTTSW